MLQMYWNCMACLLVDLLCMDCISRPNSVKSGSDTFWLRMTHFHKTLSVLREGQKHCQTYAQTAGH